MPGIFSLVKDKASGDVTLFEFYLQGNKIYEARKTLIVCSVLARLNKRTT